MVAILKYVTLIVSGGLGVFLTFYKEKAYRRADKLAQQKRLRACLIGVALVSMVLGVLFVWLDDKSSEEYKSWQRQKINLLNDKVALAVSQVTNAQMNLAKANDRLVEQSRSLSSLILNVKSSEEGKMAFVSEFKKVFRALDPSNEKIMIQELLCDEGVVIYLFNKDDVLTGFHLYTDADVNDALAGTRLDPLIFSKSVTTVLQPEMTISKAIEKMTFGRTPKRGGNVVEREQAFERIRAMLENICRYVYRAESFTLFVNGEGRGFLSFYYYPNPKARKYSQGVEVKLDRHEIEGLYDIQMDEFVKRALRMFSSRGVEPKVTRSEIFSVNSTALIERRKVKSPFRGVWRP